MTLEELKVLLSTAPQEVVADVEHLPDAEPGLASLLGVALCWPGSEGLYIPVNHWAGVPSAQLVPLLESSSLDRLQSFFRYHTLMGWNIEHDREWVDACFGVVSTWSVDGRILWYLTDTEQKERGYGLKKAQVALLNWEASNDKILRDVVFLNGGSVDRGQHYLADVVTLGRYASLDAYSTLCVVELLRPRLVADNLFATHDANRDYAAFLSKATRSGVTVDEFSLLRAKRFYEEQVQLAETHIREVCDKDIQTLEATFLSNRIQRFKSEKGVASFMASPSRHPRFNPNSSTQRSQLLHDVIGLPVVSRTETGKPKSDKNTIAAFDHPSAQAFVKLSKNEKLLQFTEQYLQHSKNGVIHFPHDTTATVSERLGGYAPYDLNMPFSSEPIMRSFGVRPGYLGIHMDLVSIEPCLIAGFSGDATMLKVYRDGLGDLYLDLCLELFPLEEANEYGEEIASLIRAFHRDYDPSTPPSSAQKERFGRLRKIAKIIQLAVGYTGTKYTVAKNLTQAGFPTSIWKADVMVTRYWQRFNKVAILAGKLKILAERNGYINGLFGRRLYIPKRLTKDALNRFGQHGGHAILRDIVMNLDRRSGEVGMRPLLPDLHDASSWEVPEENINAGIKIFEDAVGDVNRRLGLPVKVAGEIKTFKTFFGLKGKE